MLDWWIAGWGMGGGVVRWWFDELASVRDWWIEGGRAGGGKCSTRQQLQSQTAFVYSSTFFAHSMLLDFVILAGDVLFFI